jgi:L-lactate dehydrogenase complex protein LldG
MDAVSRFEAALADQSTVHRTTAADFAATIDAAVAAPAVGTSVPYDGVSLAETVVERDPDLAAIDAARTGVTPAEIGVADYGTVTLPSTADGAELCSLYVDRHVAVLAESALVDGMGPAFECIAAQVASGAATQILATGPSATADMGELIRGVHGPHETHVVVVTDR